MAHQMSYLCVQVCSGYWNPQGSLAGAFGTSFKKLFTQCTGYIPSPPYFSFCMSSCRKSLGDIIQEKLLNSWGNSAKELRLFSWNCVVQYTYMLEYVSRQYKVSKIHFQYHSSHFNVVKEEEPKKMNRVLQNPSSQGWWSDEVHVCGSLGIQATQIGRQSVVRDQNELHQMDEVFHISQIEI